MKRISMRSWSVWLLIALLLGGLVMFLIEYFMEGSTWVMHSGNPHVYESGDSSTPAKGTVVDRDGNFLLSFGDGRVYSESAAIRKAMLHILGDRQGNILAPAISCYNQQLIGYDAVGGVYQYGSQGGQLTLTVSARVQQAALEAMGDYRGTLAVYNYKTGEILCAVSTPTYDPDAVPDIDGDTTGAYSGVYVNRFTQSVFIPGSIFKIVTTAAALEQIDDIQQQRFTCTGDYSFGADTVTCQVVHGEMDLKKAMELSCNCVYAQIALQLGTDGLQKYVEQFRVLESISFDGITSAKGNIALENQADVELAWSAIGQHKDQINPCSFLHFVGAVANGGEGVMPFLVRSVKAGGKTTYEAAAVSSQRIMSTETAQTLKELMRNNVVSNYGAGNFPGLTVCAKSGTGEVGGDSTPNALFTGFVADEQYPLAFIVVVENGGFGRPVCVPIIAKVLASCKEVLDV